MSYGISATVPRPFEETVEAVRQALSGQGFGVLTEIDLAATLKTKLDVDIAPQVILGACNPPLAHRAVQAEDSIGLLLPCNVLVRSTGEQETVVAALDPQTMVQLTANEQLRPVADEAAQRLRDALATLTS